MLAFVFSVLPLLSFVLLAKAQTSLWIPDVDPQPISVGVLGIGSDGRTTWELQQGTPTGTFTDPADNGFPFTATMVQGPSDAVITYGLTTEGQTLAASVSCAINDGIAVCAETISEGPSASTMTHTETVVPILVQGGGTATPASAGSSATSSGAAATGKSSGSAATGTSSGTAATGTSGKNSALRYQVGHLGLAITLGSVLCYIL